MQWYGSTLIVATEAEDEEGRSHNKVRRCLSELLTDVRYLIDTVPAYSCGCSHAIGH